MSPMTFSGERKTIPSCPSITNRMAGIHQTPHVATAKDEQNRDAFLWNHFFGGDPLLNPPTSRPQGREGQTARHGAIQGRTSAKKRAHLVDL